MRYSLRSRIALMIAVIAVTLSTVSILVSSHTIQRLVDTSYQERAVEISKTVAAVLDAEKALTLKNEIMTIYRSIDNKVGSDAWGTPEFDAYCAQYSGLEQSEEFVNMRQTLRRIQDANDVDCVYLATIDVPTESFIYLVDAAYEDACPPGCIDPLYEENRELLKNPDLGFPPYITNTEPYGWLVTAGVPVYDSTGHVVCYALVDISMETIRIQQNRFVLLNILILAVLTLIISLISIWSVDRAIIKPINLLSNAAAHYSARQGDSNELDNLPIKSKDEIYLLYSSLLKMAQNTRSYIESLKATRQVLTETRREADEMNELAHRDPLTGVGSKLAYDQQVTKLTEEMRRGEARYGIVMIDMNDLKKLNDTYGHERGNDAIRKTCSTICEVFAHSPVYRFGGDEFVVVVKGSDYENTEELVKKFHAAVKTSAGQPWERVNAAIGYALYDGEDSVEEVFRKADSSMYEQKKKTKSGRKH